MSPKTTACPSGDEKVLLFGLLMDTNARLTKDLNEVLEKNCELPLASFDALLQLRRVDSGRLKMNELADAIVHSTGGTTRLIDRLAEAGLVVREQCPTDRRAIYVAITQAGNQKLDEALATHLDFLQETMAGRLSAGERESLTSLLGKLNAH
jgi:DNA-binding MarR family transcriptional regulator